MIRGKLGMTRVLSKETFFNAEPGHDLLHPSRTPTLPCSDPHVVSTFSLASIWVGNFERLKCVEFLALYYESYIFKN